jgi:hypothetical protein
MTERIFALVEAPPEKDIIALASFTRSCSNFARRVDHLLVWMRSGIHEMPVNGIPSKEKAGLLHPPLTGLSLDERRKLLQTVIDCLEDRYRIQPRDRVFLVVEMEFANDLRLLLERLGIVVKLNLLQTRQN